MYLYEGVDCHDSHIWLTLGIVHQVEVNQLLQFQVVCLHAVDNIWEQSTGGETRYYVTTASEWKVKCYTVLMWMSVTLFPLAHLTSLPTVIEAMTFFTASFFFSFLSLFSSALSSKISPVCTRQIHHVILLSCKKGKEGLHRKKKQWHLPTHHNVKTGQTGKWLTMICVSEALWKEQQCLNQ